MMVELSMTWEGHREMLLNHFEEDVLGRDLLIRTTEGYIHCHRLLLAAVSPFFRKVLLEDPPENDLSLVVMTDFLSSEVRELVSSAYAKNSSPESFINMFSDLTDFRTKLPDEDPLELNATLDSLDSFKSRLSKQSRVEAIFVVPDICDDDDLDVHDLLQTVEENGECDLRNRKRKRYETTTTVKKKKNDAKIKKKVDSKEKTKRAKKYPVLCQGCSCSLNSKKEVKNHNCDLSSGGESKENVDVSDIICHLCGISFVNRSLLSSHLSMKCENVCSICKTIFSNRSDVREHMLMAHHKILKRKSNLDAARPYQCALCSRNYVAESHLKVHVTKNHSIIDKDVADPPQKFQCQDCGKLVSSKLALKKHVSLHKPPGLGCPICGKMFHNKSYLSRHVISQHGEQSDKKHKCDMCEKGFNNKMALEGHKNWHLNIKPYQCRWCVRTYQNTSNCAAHERKTHRANYESALQNGNRRVQNKQEPLISLIEHGQKEDRNYIVS